MLDTYVHDDVESYVLETAAGPVTSTAEHPFWVDGRGWTPVREVQPGDRLVDAEGVRVELVSVVPTGQSATVHNFNVEHLHSYHVRVGDSWVLVHNTCGTEAYSHPFEYHPRITTRALQDPRAHNFPYSFDDEILS